jgi:hypothetical protein
MAKLIFRSAEFPTLELLAREGEEIPPELALPWAIARSMLSLDFLAVSLQRAAEELVP